MSFQHLQIKTFGENWLTCEEDKRKYRDEHFATDLKNAYELGKRLVGKCQEG